MKSSFTKNDKRHLKTELFSPRCGLYYLVFNVQNVFLAKTDNHQYVYPLKLKLFRKKTDKRHFRRVAYSN